MLLRTACDTNIAGEFVARELADEQTLDNLYAFGDRLQHVHDLMRARRADTEAPR